MNFECESHSLRLGFNCLYREDTQYFLSISSAILLSITNFSPLNLWKGLFNKLTLVFTNNTPHLWLIIYLRYSLFSTTFWMSSSKRQLLLVYPFYRKMGYCTTIHPLKQLLHLSSFSQHSHVLWSKFFTENLCF